MIKLILLILFSGNVIISLAQEIDKKVNNKSIFYITPQMEFYSLKWVVRGYDFTSKLTWSNNIKTGVSFGYQRSISNKIFFSDIGIARTISGKGTDIDRFSSGAEIKTEFQSDESTFINLRLGAQIIKNRQEKWGFLLQLNKDNLKLHSKTVFDLNSRYVIRKSNLGLNYNYSLNVLNTIVEVGAKGGIGYNYAIATWNKIESLKQPKSFDHSSFTYDLGFGSLIEISSNLSLNISYSSGYLIRGKERTFLTDGNIHELNLEKFNNQTVTLGVKYLFL